jgi:hypothetical protein
MNKKNYLMRPLKGKEELEAEINFFTYEKLKERILKNPLEEDS